MFGTKRLVLRFKPPKFENGQPILFTTFRRGLDWLNRFTVGNDEAVAVNPQGDFLGYAKINRVAYLPLIEVKPEWILTGVERAFSLVDLRNKLQQYYGPEFNYDSYVTVLFFEVN